MGEARKAIISLGAMVDRLLGRKGSEVEKAGPMNIQTGPRGGRYYVAKTGEKVYVDKNGQPVSGGDGGKKEGPGEHVRNAGVVKVQSGPSAGQVGILMDQTVIKTDANGVPKGVPGVNKPIDWKKEVVVRFEGGKYEVHPISALRPEHAAEGKRRAEQALVNGLKNNDKEFTGTQVAMMDGGLAIGLDPHGRYSVREIIDNAVERGNIDPEHFYPLANRELGWKEKVPVAPKSPLGKLTPSQGGGPQGGVDEKDEKPTPPEGAETHNFTWGRTGPTASPHKPKDHSTGFHGSVSQTLGSSVVTPDYKKIQADYQAALESYTRHPSKEELADLQKAVSRMSEHLQKPVVHHELAGKAYHEVVQRMVSQGMVKSDNEARAVLDGREGNRLAQYMKPDHLQNQNPEDRVNQMLKLIQSGGFDETLETAIKFHREAQSGEKTDSAHKALLIDESRPGRRILSLVDADEAQKGVNNIQTGPRGGRYYIASSGEKIYVDKNDQPIGGSDPKAGTTSASAESGKKTSDENPTQQTKRENPTWVHHLWEQEKVHKYSAEAELRRLKSSKTPVDPKKVEALQTEIAKHDKEIKNLWSRYEIALEAEKHAKPDPESQAAMWWLMGRRGVAVAPGASGTKKSLGRRVLSLNAMSLDQAEKAEPAKRGTPKEPEAKEPPPQAYQPASDKKVPASGGDNPVAEVNAQLLNAFRAWNAQRDGGQSANAPEWAKPASPDETPWQFAQRAAVELGKTDAGQAVQEEYGSGREWIDYVALTLKASGEKTSRVEGTTPAPTNPATPPPPATDEATKGDKTYLTGPEAVEFILWEVDQKAKDWCEWKRGNNNVAGEPCYCSPAEALAEETRRKNETAADAAENRAKNYLCDVSWGSDTHIRAMREIGGLSAFRDKLIEVFLATVATENAVAPVPGCDATVPVVEPSDVAPVAFPDQV